MKKITLFVIVATILAKLFGFFRELALSYFFGTASIADAYLISLTLPDLIFSLIGSAILVGFIPIYIGKTNKKEKIQFTKKVLGSFTIFSIVLIGVIYIFTEPILLIFAPGFNIELMSQAVSFSKVTVISIFTTSYVFILKSYLNSRNRFILATIYTIPTNIIIIMMIYFAYRYNLDVLHWGYLIATSIQFFLFLPLMFKEKIWPTFVNIFNDNDLKSFMILIFPVILSVAVSDLNSIIDKSFSSLITIGGVSALNYASKVNQFIKGVFIISILTVVYPKTVNAAITENRAEFEKNIQNALLFIIVIIAPVFIGISFFSKEIIQLLFYRGAFSNNDVMITSSILYYYNLGLIFIVLSNLYTRIFYAKKMNHIPLIYAVLVVIINVLLNFIFYYFTDIGLSGIALATSVSIAIGISFMIIVSLKYKIKVFTSNIFINLTKIFLLAFITILSVKMLNTYILRKYIINMNLNLIIVVILSGIIYLTTIYLCNIANLNLYTREYIRQVIKKTRKNT